MASSPSGRPAHTPLERASAAVLACGDHAVLSHEAALALWGLRRRWPKRFHVTLTRGDRRPKGITVHRATGLTRADTTIHLGVPVTSLARTVLDCAPTTPAPKRARLVNDALLSLYLTPAQLADTISRFPHHPGSAMVRPHLPTTREDEPTRSGFEDDFKAFCAAHGLPRPVTNVRIGRHRVDALFPGHKLIVELDGWTFHNSKASFRADRDRDADTLAAGYATVRITEDRMKRPDAEAERLHAILAARGVRPTTLDPP